MTATIEVSKSQTLKIPYGTYSHKALTSALQEFPLAPLSAKMTFYADGITDPRYGTDEESVQSQNKYFELCEKNKVIPGTLSFIGNWRTHTIQPYHGSESGIHNYENPALAKRVARLAVRGGRFQKQQFTFNSNGISGASGEEAFENFRKDTLPLLIEENYLVGDLDLWLTRYYSRGGCYEGSGYSVASSVAIGWQRDLELRLYEERADEPLKRNDVLAVKRWFRKFKKEGKR